MIVGFDHVSREVFAHPDGGPIAFAAPAAAVTIKHYLQRGIVYIELAGEATTLSFLSLDGAPGTVGLEPAGPGRWRVVAGG